jgi:hypothetical protein
MPGKVESMAVSSVQSMSAPFGSRKRSVGSTEASTAGVTLGRSSAARELSPAAGDADGFEGCGAAHGGPEPLVDIAVGIAVAPSPDEPGPEDSANTAPWSSRSKALVLTCAEGVIGGDGVAAPKRAS